MKKRKLKFDFKLTDFVEPHILRIYLLSLAGVLLAAFLVIVGVLIFRSIRGNAEEEGQQLYSEEDISSILKSPGLTDFIIPESLDSGEKGFTMYREPMKKWSDEMVDRYIIPPEEIGIDQIREENKKLLEQKLDEIP